MQRMVKSIAYYAGQVLLVIGALVCVGPLVGGFASAGDVGAGWGELLLGVGGVCIVAGGATILFGAQR
ncbi:MAG: hypothetical protein CMJ17_17245 [Phenylobacterium sp.]|jgi:hypothetical protein|nr:hypothetical protein [Phenylobacterium sp.]|tara:strand:+ start:2544 stop:2747 length:204 start_codon:yes stop_codon:yes gene_type:complete